MNSLWDRDLPWGTIIKWSIYIVLGVVIQAFLIQVALNVCRYAPYGS